MKKSISTIIAVSVLMSACTKSEKTIVNEVHPQPVPSQNQPPSPPPTEPEKPSVIAQVIPNEVRFSDLVELMKIQGLDSNLTDVLIKEYKKQHSEEIQSWDLQPQQLLALKENLNQEHEQIKKQYFVGTSRVSMNEKFLTATSANQLNEMARSGAFASKIELQVAVMAQSESLRKIFDILNHQMEKNSRSLARDIVADWKKNNPQALADIDQLIGLETRQRIGAIQESLKKHDRILAKYDFSDDGSKLIIYGLIAGVMADSLKENGTVKALLQVAEEAKNLATKVNEIRLSIATLDKYRRDLKKNWDEVSSTFKAVQEDLAFYKNEGGFDAKNLDVSDRTKAELSRAVNDVLDGKFNQEAAKDQKGLFTQGHDLNANVQGFLTSATKTADSFSGVISSVRVISNQLGVEISPDLDKALKTASQISQGVKLGAAIIQGYSSGGLVGALGAFSGGPATAVLGGVATMAAQQQNEAYYKAILAEINKLKELQLETIQLQKNTLQMVRELAVMVDEYHKEDLFQMKQIYHQVVVTTEISSLLMQKNLQYCQFALNNLFFDYDEVGRKGLSLASIDSVDEIRGRISQKMQTLRSPSRFIESESQHIGLCSLAMSEAFDRKIDFGSLVFARYDVRRGVAQATIEANLYAGSLRYLKEKAAKGNSLEDMALHLPVAKMDSLFMKDYYVHTNGQGGAYDYLEGMQNLLSPEALEAYVTSLLSMHSLISVNSNDWASSEQLLRATYSAKRSAMWLRGALDQVKTAIAQNALLVGEPVLSNLATDWKKIVTKNSACKDLNDEVNYLNFCFVRQNPLVMKNLLIYMLRQRSSALNQAELDKSVASILGVSPERIVSVDGKKYLSLSDDGSFRVQIPSLSEIFAGYVNYSESMPHLLKMQNLLADEAAKFAPSKAVNDDAETLAKVYILR